MQCPKREKSISFITKDIFSFFIEKVTMQCCIFSYSCNFLQDVHKEQENFYEVNIYSDYKKKKI